MRPTLAIDAVLESLVRENRGLSRPAGGSAPSVSAMLDRVADLAARMSAAGAGYLRLTDRRLQWMRPGRALWSAWPEQEILAWIKTLAVTDVALFSDLQEDARLRETSLVARPDGVRACAAMPIRGPVGEALGMLYVLDAAARRWDEASVSLLRSLSTLTADILAGWIASIPLEANTFEPHPNDQRFRELFENNTDLVYIHDLRGRITAINQVAERILGYSRRELLGQGIDDIVVPEHAAIARQMLLEQIGGGIPMNYQLGFRVKDGREVSLDVSTHLLFTQGQPVGLMCFGRQVPRGRDSAVLESRLALMSPERLIEVLKSRIEVARAANLKFVIAMLAIESFRLFEGDVDRIEAERLAGLVADLLKKTLHRQEAAAAVGADRFLVVFPVPTNHHEVVHRVEAILQRIRGQYRVDTLQSVVTASAGLSVFPESGQDASSLISSAEGALFSAKQHGSNSIRSFSPEDRESLLDCLEVERSLQRAIGKRQLALRFQPLLRLDGTLDSLEVLLSWNHPDRGLIPAGQYIPIAEASGAIVPIGAWVLREACRQSAAWQKRGYPQVTFAVNVSALQFVRPEFADTVASILHETGLSPENVELEITESAIMRDIEQSVLTMTALRELGIKLSIDDFGTGYSSLSYIRRLPATSLKIDRSFLVGGSAESGPALLQKIVLLAHSVGLRVVAEGVESLEHFELIRQAGCDRMQGHLFGRSVSAREAGRLVVKSKHGPLWLPVR